MNGIDLNTHSGPSSAPRSQRRDRLSAPPGATLKTLAAATAVALLLLPGVRQARAQVIGELDVRSRLGERFFAAVPVQSTGAILDPRCIRVSANPSAPAGAEPLQGARVRIGSGGANFDTVIIETAGAVMSPIVGLRLEVGCESPVTRDYLVLGEGASLPGAPAIAEAAPAAQAPATSEQVSTTPVPVAVQPAAKPVAPRRAAPQPRAAPTARAAAPAPTPARGAPSADARPPVPAAADVRSTAQSAPAPRAAATPAPASADQDARRVAELRARSDDQAAALLALDDRLALLQKQAELLKAQLEQVLAAPAPQASATAPVAPTAAVATTAATPESKPTTTPVAQPAPATSAPVAAAPARREQGMLDLVTDWRVAAGGLTALLLGAIVLKLRRRPSERAAAKFSPSATAAWPKGVQMAQPEAPAAAAGPYEHEKTQEFRAVPIPETEKTVEWTAAPRASLVDQTAEWVPPPTTDTLPLPESGPSPEAAKPKLPGAGISREFHITQQFQPVAERVVALSSPEEIVQQARTHYMEDGDIFRAIDLLEMAVSARKDSTRPWQALFAIYRRENMPERFQRLVLAYRGVFGQDESWPAIRTLGHAIDPNNPLYGGEALTEPIPEDLVERWLGVPLDFTAHLLANEMHDQLMDTFPGRSKKRKRMAGE